MQVAGRLFSRARVGAVVVLLVAAMTARPAGRVPGATFAPAGVELAATSGEVAAQPLPTTVVEAEPDGADGEDDATTTSTRPHRAAAPTSTTAQPTAPRAGAAEAPAPAPPTPSAPEPDPATSGTRAPEPAHDPVDDGPRRVSLSGLQADALRLLNASRAEHGLAPLVAVSDAQAKAQAHAEELARAGRLSHSSDLSAGIEDGWRSLGENVARGSSVADAHERLLGEPGHRANILNTRFNQVGVGVAVVDGVVTLVQFFVER